MMTALLVAAIAFSPSIRDASSLHAAAPGATSALVDAPPCTHAKTINVAEDLYDLFTNTSFAWNDSGNRSPQTIYVSPPDLRNGTNHSFAFCERKYINWMQAGGGNKGECASEHNPHGSCSWGICFLSYAKRVGSEVETFYAPICTPNTNACSNSGVPNGRLCESCDVTNFSVTPTPYKVGYDVSDDWAGSSYAALEYGAAVHEAMGTTDVVCPNPPSAPPPPTSPYTPRLRPPPSPSPPVPSPPVPSPAPTPSDGGSPSCFAKLMTTACLLSSACAPFECKQVLMADLAVGDLVLTAAAGVLAATTVIAVQHKAVDTIAEMLTFDMADGTSVSMTPDHAIFADGQLVAAAEAKVGSTLTNTEGDSVAVERITKSEGAIINAVTASGTILADGVLAASNPLWVASLTVDAPIARAVVNAVLYAVGDVDSIAAGFVKVAATLALAAAALRKLGKGCK